MSSPFSTIEEFNGAVDGPTEGAIYTFANTPIINSLALVVAAGIFIWFMAATYSTHVKSPAVVVDKSLNRLSSFIVIGLLSLVAADHRQGARSERAVEAIAQSSVLQAPGRAAPFALLGMVGIGLPSSRRRKRKRQAQGLSDYRSKR